MGTCQVMHIAGSVNLGGAEKHLLMIVDNIDRQFEIYVVCPCYGRLVKELNDRGVETLVMGTREKYSPSTVLRLSGIMRENDIQIVHSHGARSDLYSRISASLVGIPIHISTLHHSVYAAHFLKTWVYRSFYLSPVYRPDKLIALSEAGVAELVCGCGVDRHRVAKIPIGIDIGRFDPTKRNSSLRQALYVQREALVVGMVAQLVPQKGHIHLLEAMRGVMRAFPEAKCLIVGDGPLRPKLEDLAEKLKVSACCIFTGARDDIPEVLSALDVWVLSSAASEGLPHALLEAMAMAKPVVATKVGGIPELVKDGITGLLVPPRDPIALEAAIIALLTDRERAQEMGRRGREVVIKSFTQEVMVRRIEALYRALIEEKGWRRCRRS